MIRAQQFKNYEFCHKFCTPNETITSDDQDPPWMNSIIKNLIRAKDKFSKKFVRESNNMDHLCALKTYKTI